MFNSTTHRKLCLYLGLSRVRMMTAPDEHGGEWHAPRYGTCAMQEPKGDVNLSVFL